MYEFYNGLLSYFISAHRKFHSWDLFAEVWEVRWLGTFYPVADLREGPGGPPPVIFRLNWGPKGRKSFFGDQASPLFQGLGDCPPPSYLKVWIRHCYHLVNLKQLPMALTPFLTFQLSSRMHHRYRVLPLVNSLCCPYSCEYYFLLFC